MSNKIQKAIDYLENMGSIYGESAGMPDCQADAALDTLLVEFYRLRKQRDDLLTACEAMVVKLSDCDPARVLAEGAITKAKGETK